MVIVGITERSCRERTRWGRWNIVFSLLMSMRSVGVGSGIRELKGSPHSRL